MPLMRDKQFLGLDLGQSSAKLVQLALHGKAVQVTRTALFEARHEGLLDEAELYAGTASWLKEQGLAEREFSVGLPQHLATTQVSDFPPNTAGDELQEMVRFETVQLAGLSDEAFASDYHVMAPDYGRKNPVLIGICRQAAVEERNQAFWEAGIHVRDIAMEGMAAANALFFLKPEVVAEKAPQMILDIGAESSTLLVIAGGQVLFVGALLFGASRFGKAAAQAEAGGHALAQMRLDLAQFDSPFIDVYRQLDTEVRNSIDHWKAGERQEIAAVPFAKVWLCGGGAKLDGLAESLGRTHGCEADVFGPAGDDGRPDPQLAVALGLALQGGGAAPIAISLCPEPIRWSRLRRERFGYLLAAVVILVCLTTLFLYRRSRELDRREREIDNQIANLERCKVVIPKLEENSQLIQHHEKMLMPIVEKANRAGRFLKTIAVLEAARGEGDWFIYLADEFTFDEGKPKTDKEGAAAAPERPTRSAEIVFPGAISSLDSGELPTTAIPGTLVTNIEQLRSMVMAGQSPKRGRDILEPVRAIRAKLNDSGTFKGADVLPKPERVGREEEIFQPWATYLQGLAERRITGPFVSYMFRLPFATLDVNKPVVPPKAKAAKPAKPAPPPAVDRLDEP